MLCFLEFVYRNCPFTLKRKIYDCGKEADIHIVVLCNKESYKGVADRFGISACLSFVVLCIKESYRSVADRFGIS